MEESKKNKIWLGVLIGILAILVVGLTAFIIYDKVLSDDHESLEVEDDNVYQEQNNNGNNSENTDSEDQVTLNYEVVTVSNDPVQKKLVVNGKDSGIVGFDIYDINYSNDALLLTVSSLDTVTIYIVDKDAKVVNSFVGNSYTNINHNHTKLKGSIIRESYIVATEKGGFFIKSDNLSQDPQYVVCNMQQNEIVEYTEWFSYLGNGKLSNDTDVKTTTAKEYIQNNSIKCN